MNTGKVWCCDWGSSSLRLRLADIKSGRTLAQYNGQGGIVTVYNNWRTSQAPNKSHADFFLDFICQRITGIEKGNIDNSNLPIIISGMASSSFGIKEIPYAATPFPLNGSNANISFLDTRFGNKVILVSGIKTQSDVMRGEETQLIGLFKQYPDLFASKSVICILPGTHSKHTFIKDESVIDFKTYMTGEMLDILIRHSLLKNCVKKPGENICLNAKNTITFKEGVIAGAEGNLIHTAFTIRANSLLNDTPSEDNFYFLIGMLIGYELTSTKCLSAEQIILCCGNRLYPYYVEAIKMLKLASRTRFLAPEVIESCYVFGQLQILERLNTLSSY